MPAPPLHPNEQERLTALHALHLLDTPPEERFDRIVRLAQKFFNVPIALVSLVDLNRQWFKSRIGLEATELPRATSFCGHAILQKEPLIIEDARKDARVLDNPLVTEEPYICFYAGHPLSSTSGQNLGTLCLVDFKPRPFTSHDIATLRDFAALAEKELNTIELNQALTQLHKSEKQKELILKASPDPIIFYDLEGHATYINKAFTDFFGWSAEEIIGQKINFVPNTEKTNTQQAISRLFKEKSITGFQTQRLTKQGSILDVEINAAFILNETGQTTGTIVILRDITERQKAQKALIENQKRLHHLVSKLAVGLLLLGKEGQLLLQNDRANELLGHAFTEFIGANQQISHLINEKGELLNDSPLKRAYLGQTIHQEVIGILGDKIRWLLINAESQSDNNTETDQIICSLIDITERKVAEEEGYYAKQLRVAATISSELNTILDVDRLLQTAVSRLKEGLGLNHVHLYLLDSSTEKLLMRVGSGEVGWKLRQRNHSIPLKREESIIARVAREAKSLLIQDTTTNGHYLPNPLLPKTRSELAIPLIARGRLLGVLDVQNNNPNSFRVADTDVLGTLASQIAIALENAELFEAQVRNTAALQQSEARLRTIISNAELVLFALDQNGKFTFAEGRALGSLGLLGEELIGASFFDFYKNTPQLQEDGKRALRGEQFSSLVKLSDTYLEFSYSALYGAGGQIIGTIGVAIDVRERELAQESIYQQRAYLRQIIDLNPNFIFAKDRAGRFTLANKAVADAYGTTPKGLIGKSDADFNPNQAEVEAFRKDDLMVLDLQEEKIIPEEIITDSQGQMRWLQTIKRPIINEKGEAFQVLGVATDMTLRKIAERERENFTNQLKAAAEIAEQIHGILNVDELLEKAISQLQERFALYHVHLYLLDEPGEQLIMYKGSGPIGEVLRQRGHHIRLDKEKSLVARAGRLRQLVLVNDVKNEPYFMANELLPNTRSEIAVPLLSGERLLGVLDIQDDESNRFGNSESDIFRTLGGLLATALKNAELFEQKQKDLEITHLRLKLNEAFGGALKEEEVLAQLLNYSIMGEGIRVTLLMVEEKEEEGLTLVVYESLFIEENQNRKKKLKPYQKGERFKASDFPFSSYLENESYFVTNDAFADHRIDEQTLLKQTGSQSFLLASLAVGEELYGYISIGSAQKNRFDKQKIALYQTIAERGGLALREARLREGTIKARQEVEQEQAFLQSILSTLPVGVYVTDKEGGVLRTNQMARQLLGGQLGEQTASQAPNFDSQLIEAESQKDYPEYKLPRLQTLADGQVHSAEDIALLYPDGTKANLSVQSGPLLDAHGKMIGATVVFSDITERKIAEEKLRASEERHRAILRATPDLMFRFSRDGIYLDIEAGQAHPLPKLLQEGVAIEREALVGRKLLEVVPPHVANKMLAAIEQALEMNKIETIEYELTTEAGVTTYEARLVVSGEDEVLAVVRDITEQKEAQIERERFTTQLRTAALLTAQLTSILEPERLLEEIVKQLQERFGFYHVHIYLLEESSERLFMRAGSGEIGQQLRQLGHSIEMSHGQSIVARAASLQKMILVDDVTEVDYYYRNPLLPETRSEVAIPLISRTELIGILDVQEDKRKAFTEGDLHTLTTLAAQIATSLQNATLFQEIQRISETRLHAVLDNVLDGIMTINDEGIIESFNPAAERIFAYTAQEAVGKAFSVEKLIPDYKRLGEGYHESKGRTKAGTLIAIEIGLRTIKLASQSITITIIRDITERKKAEEALRESEERFRQLAENIGEVFWISDPYKKELIYISPAYQEIWGVSPEKLYQRAIIDGISPLGIEHVHPQDAGRLVNGLPKELKGQCKQEYRIIRPDGQIRWIAEQAFPVKNKEGQTYRLVGVAHDVTTRKLAEAQQAHLKQLKIAADLSEQLTSILEHDRLLEAVVSRLQEYFGFYHVHIYLFDAEKQELVMEVGSGEIGQKLRQQKHKITLNIEHSIVTQAARERKPIIVDDVYQSMHFLPNPQLPATRSEVALPILSAGQLLGVLDVQDDEVARFTANDIDVLRTIAGQVAIALENAHLFEQVEQSLEETAIRFEISQALAKSQSEEEVLNAIIEQALSYQRSLNHHQSQKPAKSAPTANFQIVISTEVEESEEECLIVRRHAQPTIDGKIMPLELQTILNKQTYPILNYLRKEPSLISNHIQKDERFDHDVHQYYKWTGAKSIALYPLTVGGQLLGIIALSSSETQSFKKDKEHYFYQSLAQQGAVALRSAQLFDHTQRTADHLRTLDRLKSEFLANMSHELRTPLNSIIGYSEIMLMGINGPLNEDMKEDMEAIRNSGQHLLRLINDILDLAKIEAGKMSLEVKELELSGLLDEIRVSHAALLRNKPVEMMIEIASDVPAIRADRVRLNQILTNLVSNAIKFTERGIIYLKANHQNGCLAISVEDQGIGIEKEDLPLIFAEFRQVDGSSTRRAEGTGLGLAITKHLVNMHGGTIKVESTLGKGSTFTIELPISGPPEQQEQ